MNFELSTFKVPRWRLALVVALGAMIGTANGAIINGSFESGFSGWITDDMSNPFYSLAVRTAGTGPGYSLFTALPTSGGLAATHGFDGGGPDTISLAQDVTILAGTWNNRIEFDYRAGWSIGGSLARTFGFEVRPAGGGSPISGTTLLTANPGTAVLDTGSLHGSILVDAFLGTTRRMQFQWYIPQNYTGPAHFQLDSVMHTFVNNIAPLANLGGPYTGILGNDLTLSGALSSDANSIYGDFLSYAWDLDSDGAFDDATGVAPLVSTAFINSLGLGTHTIRLRVTDYYGLTSSALGSLQINAPASAVPEPTTAGLWLVGGLVCWRYGRNGRRSAKDGRGKSED